MKWIYLTFAIIFEIVATTSLKYSEGFTKLKPTVIMVVAYIISFYFLSVTLKHMPIGIAYAIWSALGIVLISAIGYFWMNETLDFPAILGMIFIIAGVAIINLFSKSLSH